jgi:hypothetical protein
MWGHILGETVSSIRTGRSYLKKREELEAMGFSYLASVQVHSAPRISPACPLDHHTTQSPSSRSLTPLPLPHPIASQMKYEREYAYTYVRSALTQYKAIHGHLKPKTDEVCEGDAYPENLRGFKIGLVVPHIRTGRCFKDMRADLEVRPMDTLPRPLSSPHLAPI